MKRHLFAQSHPVVLFFYFFGAAVLSMCTLHPVFVAISFVSSGIYCMSLQGIKRYAKRLLYSLFLFIFVTGFNVLTNSLGLSVIGYLGDHPITVEAICYGACFGGMLLSALQWFTCFSLAFSSDQFISLFGAVFPSSALLFSMVLRYVPDTFRQAQEIRFASQGLLGEKPTRLERFAFGVRTSNVLVGWSMENALETADAMRNKGYTGGRRTRFRKERFTASDGVTLTFLILFFALSVILLVHYARQFQFYPILKGAEFSWPMLLYGLFFSVPLWMEVKEGIWWLRSRL